MNAGLHPNLIDEHDSTAPADLVRDLERLDHSPRPSGAILSSLVAFFSLGLLPALLWHDRFRQQVESDRRLVARVTAWLRGPSDQPETTDLNHHSGELGTRPLLSFLLLVCVLGVIAVFGAQLSGVGNDGRVVDRVFSWTYQFHPPRRMHPPASVAQKVHVVWAVGLSLAYLFHFLQVRGHVSDVRRLVSEMNRVFLRSGGRAVATPKRLEIGILWIVAGIFFATRGAWWGLPMAVCGSAQQQYMRTESARLRRSLAARIRDVAHLPIAPTESSVARRCSQVRCLAVVPGHARFCPRCGNDLNSGVAPYVPRLTNSV